MTTALAKSAVESSLIIRTDIGSKLPDTFERKFRSGVADMSRKIKGGVPARFRTWRYESTAASRKQNPAGKLPEYALACLRSGAPLADVLRPLNELVGWIRSHAPRITCLASAAVVDECIRELNELIAAAETVRDALYARRYQEKTR